MAQEMLNLEPQLTDFGSVAPHTLESTWAYLTDQHEIPRH